MAGLHPCCDPTSPRAIWEGTPAGKIIGIDGIETYIARPEMLDGRSKVKPSTLNQESPNRQRFNRVILFLTEGHGIYLPNAQLLADSFASRLCCDVIMPNQFIGQARLDKDQKPFLPTREGTNTRDCSLDRRQRWPELRAERYSSTPERKHRDFRCVSVQEASLVAER